MKSAYKVARDSESRVSIKGLPPSTKFMSNSNTSQPDTSIKKKRYSICMVLSLPNKVLHFEYYILYG